MRYFILNNLVMVVIQNSINNELVNEQKLTEVMQRVIDDLDKGSSELLIRIVDEQEIQNLNKTYRDKDKTTNVLSFPSDLPIEIDESILGDVVICTSVVKAEANSQNKSFNDHLIHMAVHGTLHLLGYDHIEDNDAQKMEDLEIKILEKMQIANPYS